MSTKIIAAVAHKAHVEARQGHQGQANRAQTFTNRKREASRKACRKGQW